MRTLQVSRNDLCPCESGQKYKACCFPKRFADPRTLPRKVQQATNGAVYAGVDPGIAPLAKRDRPALTPANLRGQSKPIAEPMRPAPRVRSGIFLRPLLPDRFYVLKKGFRPFQSLKADEWVWFLGGWLRLRQDPLAMPPVPVLKRLPSGEPRTIRSTAEHPFYVFGRGWTPLQEIKPGEWLRGEDDWVEVGTVENTGKWETVYNFRVKDNHTYFVGSREWGFSVWAHNADCAQQAAALKGIEERLGGLTRTNEVLLKNSAAAIHNEILNIAETAIQVGRSTARGNHVGQIFKDLLQPLHAKLEQLGSRFNIEIEPRVLNGRRILGKLRNHDRLDAIITELPPGAGRPALDPARTFEIPGVTLEERTAAMRYLEPRLDEHSILYGYDISVAHYPIGGHLDAAFTSASPLTKVSVVQPYTDAFAPLARPGFQVYDVRVIGDQFLINGVPRRPVRQLSNGVLE